MKMKASLSNSIDNEGKENPTTEFMVKNQHLM